MPDPARMSGRSAARARAARCHRHRAAGPRADGQQRTRARGDAGHARRPGLGRHRRRRPRAVHRGPGRGAGHRRNDHRRRDAALAGVPGAGQRRGARGPGRRRGQGRGGDGGGPGGSRGRTGAAGRGRVRSGYAGDPRVPGRPADGLLPVQRRQQRPHAGGHRQTADPGFAARRRRGVAGRRPGHPGAAGRPAAHADRPVPAGLDRLPGGLPRCRWPGRSASSRPGRRRSRACWSPPRRLAG